MAQKFLIATSSSSNGFNFVGKKNTVDETLFWQTVETKIKEQGEYAEGEYEKGLQLVKEYLGKSSVTIGNTYFEIKGRP